MTTDLRRIGEKAREEPGLVFTTLYHHVTDVDNLRACYDALPKDRAVGNLSTTLRHSPLQFTEQSLLSLS